MLFGLRDLVGPMLSVVVLYLALYRAISNKDVVWMCDKPQVNKKIVIMAYMKSYPIY